MKKAIIIPNYIKSESMDFAKEAEKILIQNGYEVSVLKESDEPSGDENFAIVLGGDGTVLRA